MELESLQYFEIDKNVAWPYSRIHHYQTDDLKLELPEYGIGLENDPLNSFIGLEMYIRMIPKIELIDYICEVFMVRVKVIAVENNKFIGKFENLGPEHKLGFDTISFEPQYACSLFGPIDWMLKHKTVCASKKVIDGEKVGYYYNSFSGGHWSQDPKVFYAISELEEVKIDIDVFEIPLAKIIDQNPEIRPYLEFGSPFGVVRISENEFKVLDEDDVLTLNSDVFLRSVEFEIDD